MTPAVAAVLADGEVVERLRLVAAVPLVGGSCATEACENDHGAGRRFCEPCRTERARARRRRWWRENGADWRARKVAA